VHNWDGPKKNLIKALSQFWGTNAYIMASLHFNAIHAVRHLPDGKERVISTTVHVDAMADAVRQADDSSPQYVAGYLCRKAVAGENGSWVMVQRMNAILWVCWFAEIEVRRLGTDGKELGNPSESDARIEEAGAGFWPRNGITGERLDVIGQPIVITNSYMA
jgi:hypothetical protein